VPDQYRDPVRPDDVGSRQASRAGSKRLCIVSHDRLRCDEFVEALQESLNPADEIEIILDRRRGRPATEAKPRTADQPSNDRRRHPYLDLALTRHGFAIVPALVTDPLKMGARRARDIPGSPADDRERLEHILDFERRQAARLRPWLILGGLVGVILVLLVVLPVVKTRVSWLRPDAPPPAEQITESPTVAQAPPDTETPSPNREAGALPPAGRLESMEPERPREASTPPRSDAERRPEASTPPRSEPERSREAERPRGARSSPRSEAERPREARTPSRSVPGPVASVPPPGAAGLKVTPPRFEGLPQVELVRNPGAEGRGEAYAVRISDPAGRPIAGAEVSLLVRMADGTALDIPLDSGLEPGTYRGTAPSGQTAPIDLRIRVITSDKRVEIPLRP
jgi:hypothetical protein